MGGAPTALIGVLIFSALALAGCATVPTPQAVDTYCLTARKVRWSTADTPETIRQAEVINRTYDLRCGYPGKVASK